jgi:hypothetical protein
MSSKSIRSCKNPIWKPKRWEVAAVLTDMAARVIKYDTPECKSGVADSIPRHPFDESSSSAQATFARVDIHKKDLSDEVDERVDWNNPLATLKFPVTIA